MNLGAVLSSMWTWLLLMILAALVVGLIVFARGHEHSRGDEIGGSHSAAVFVGER